jgi:hypothetical protein
MVTHVVHNLRLNELLLFATSVRAGIQCLQPGNADTALVRLMIQVIRIAGWEEPSQLSIKTGKRVLAGYLVYQNE